MLNRPEMNDYGWFYLPMPDIDSPYSMSDPDPYSMYINAVARNFGASLTDNFNA